MSVDRRSFLRLGASAAVASQLSRAPASLGPGPVRTRAASWDVLRATVSGDVFLPGDAGYEEATHLQVAAYDTIKPQGVVYCETAADVRDCLLFAQDLDLQVAPRSGGHCNAGYSTTTGMVVDVSRLDQLAVGSTSVAMGAGIQAIDALTVLAPQGLATPNGTCATVAAGGFVTGGGIGPLTRKYGAACDNLVGAQVVTADGRIISTSPYEKSDLFWALRGGGGGNFGVVTQYRIRPVPVTTMVSYLLAWPWDAAPQVIRAWQDWLTALSPDVSANLLITLPNAAPGVVPIVQVSGTSLGTQAALETELNELAALVGTAPAARTVLDQPYRQTMMALWGCPTKTPAQCHRVGHNPEAQLPRNVFAMHRGRFFGRSIPQDGITSLLTAFEGARRPGQARVLSFRAMGGKVNERSRTESAFVHRTSKFYLGLAYVLIDPAATADDKAAMLGVLDQGFAAMDPHSNAESFQNFMDPSLADWRQAYYGENYRRLVQVKRRYDPDGFFHFQQSIGS
jgi:FAD/FMN-containing dehydrogenase